MKLDHHLGEGIGFQFSYRSVGIRSVVIPVIVDNIWEHVPDPVEFASATQQNNVTVVKAI